MRFAEQSNTVRGLFGEFRRILRGASCKLWRRCLIARAYLNIPILEVLIACLLGLSSGEARQQTNVSQPSAKQPPIAVSIAVPADENGERRVRYRDLSTHFPVIVSNVSSERQRVWQDWNSWGYYGLTFELTDANGKTWVAKKKPAGFSRNFPSFWTLDPGDCLVLEVPFEDTNWWEGLPSPHNGSQTVTMRAILSFDADSQSRRYGVWTGRVASKPEKITFDRWDPERSR